MNIAAQAFRHYDIRGKIDQDIALSEIYRLGRAIADYMLQQRPDATTIIIGRDGRTHSAEIQRQLIQAFFDVGFTVHDTGLCPTPVVYFAAYQHTYDVALMVTASHNGPEYNGIKICLGTQSVWGEQIQQIKQLYDAIVVKGYSQLRVNSHVPTYTRVAIQQEYTDYLAQEFSDLRELPDAIIADCGNGVVGAILRTVVDAVGLRNVTILCEKVDGTYPNHQADPVEEKNMRHVIEHINGSKARLWGVGFDGDGDRMAAVTHDGQLVPGDKLLALFAQDILTSRPHNNIIFDGKCSLIVAQTIQQAGGTPIRVPSGHSIIKSAMHEHKALFAGELSCHFFFADSYFGFDDGIYAFLRLVRLVKQRGQDLSALLEQFPHTYSTPEIRIACSDAHKLAVVEQFKARLQAQRSCTLNFDDGVRFETAHGWGLVRASNTQPAICIRYESLTAQGLHELQEVVQNNLVMKELV